MLSNGKRKHCSFFVCLGFMTGSFVFGFQVRGDEVLTERGRTLFEKSNWNRRSRGFNAHSCAVCHHLGGVGGAGEEAFNARSIGIEKLRVPAKTTTARLATFLRRFHPQFVDPNETVTTVIPLPHFGGSIQNVALRAKFARESQRFRNVSLGPADHQQLLSELSRVPEYVEPNAPYPLELKAKSFQRNTPALFGLGLIDKVSDEEIRRIAARQSSEARQSGISGRPATLSTGGIGRFGWRANVATLVDFTRQACVNELGITVQSDPEQTPLGARQPARGLGTSSDVSLEELRSLTTFIATLPAPQREVPQEHSKYQYVLRGEQLFEGIGCSICHLPEIGEIKGIYSDLLLHDMGFELRGASTADPYIRSYREGVSPPTFVTLPSRSYYGRSATVPALSPNANGQVVSRHAKTLEQPYGTPPERIQFEVLETFERPVANRPRTGFRSGRSVVRQVKFRRNQISPTNVSQEWRTPPLWGLRDSAPYLHDGRAATIHQAILMHAGESRPIRDRFVSLSVQDQNAVVAFLNTLVAPADAPQQE